MKYSILTVGVVRIQEANEGCERSSLQRAAQVVAGAVQSPVAATRPPVTGRPGLGRVGRERARAKGGRQEVEGRVRQDGHWVRRQHRHVGPGQGPHSGLTQVEPDTSKI